MQLMIGYSFKGLTIASCNVALVLWLSSQVSVEQISIHTVFWFVFCQYIELQQDYILTIYYSTWLISVPFVSSFL